MKLTLIVAVVWGVFWVGWLLAAFTAGPGTRTRPARAPGLVVVIALVLFRSFSGNSGSIHSVPVQVLGLALLAAGLALAVCGRRSTWDATGGCR